MINRRSTKQEARQCMRGRQPSTYFVAAIYISILGISAALIYALTGYDRFALRLEYLLSVNPYPAQADLATALPIIRPMAIILIAAIVIVRIIISVGFKSYCLKLSRDIQADTRGLFDGFGLFFKIIRLALLRLVIITLWSLLLLVPGIIACYHYRQAYYILLDRPELGPLGCLRESKRLMAGHKRALFSLDLSFLGWQLVDRVVEYISTLRIFSIWLGPYIGITRALFYQQLTHGSSNQNTSPR